MAKETLKAQVERLNKENADLRNKLDDAIADALALNSKLNAKHDVSDSPMYQTYFAIGSSGDESPQVEKNKLIKLISDTPNLSACMKSCKNNWMPLWTHTMPSKAILIP